MNRRSFLLSALGTAAAVVTGYCRREPEPNEKPAEMYEVNPAWVTAPYEVATWEAIQPKPGLGVKVYSVKECSDRCVVIRGFNENFEPIKIKLPIHET